MSKASKVKRSARMKFPRLHPAPIMGLFVFASVIGFFNAQIIAGYATLWFAQPVAIATIPATKMKTQQKNDAPLAPQITMPAAGIQAPVVYDAPSTADADVQMALERGVLHFGDSALPGERGNAVFVGHSSGQPWAPGDYKFVFTMLERMQIGQRIELAHGTTRYVYEVTEKIVVDPLDVSVLEQTKGATATFITCTPVGTNAQRLVLHAKLVSHEPRNRTNATQGGAPELKNSLPGSSYNAAEALQQRWR